jgi:hypothetical protein
MQSVSWRCIVILAARWSLAGEYGSRYPASGDQDLITLRQTTRIALATKIENKQISPEDASAQMAQVMS